MADDAEPQYRKYRARPRLLGGRRDDVLDAVRRAGPGGRRPVPDYEVHGSRRGPRGPRLSPGRVVRWLLLGLFGWVALSLLIFLVSATLARDEVADATGAVLDDHGFPLFAPTNVLVLGSDARTPETAEPGSGGRPRSDTILLVRTGGTGAARLSIPRDVVAEIPGAGRQKINAAYAIGGPGLAVQTVQAFLDVEIHHVVEVDFERFPRFIDALGGIDYTGGCVVSRINGGFRNGGYTLRLRPGTTHLDGRQALALARTRTNECNRRESDLSRVRRQQKLLAAIKDRLTSFATFVRLPLVAWTAPRTVRTDMSGPTLLGLAGAVAIGGSPATRVLKPSGATALPDGGQGLVVSEAERERAGRRFR